MSLRPKLGELLLAAEVIDQAALDAALAKQAADGGRIGRILVALGAIDEEMLVRTVARQLDLPVVKLRGKQVKPEVLARVPGHVARTHRCVPVMLDKRGGDTLMVAMEDPSDGVALDQIAIAAELPVRVVLTSPSDLDDALRRYYPEGKDDVPRPPPAAPPVVEAKKPEPLPPAAPVPPDEPPDLTGDLGPPSDDEPELLLEDALTQGGHLAAPPASARPATPDPNRTHYAAPELARGGGELGSDLDLLARPSRPEPGEPGSIFDAAPSDLGAEDSLDTGGAAWEARVDQLDISGNDLDPGGDIDEGPDPAESSAAIDVNDLSGRGPDDGVDLMAADSLDEAIEHVRGADRTAAEDSDAADDSDETTGASTAGHQPRDPELRAVVALLIERGLLDPHELAKALRSARGEEES